MTTVVLTYAQAQLIDRLIAEGFAPTPPDVLRRTLLEHSQHILSGGSPYGTGGRTVLEFNTPQYGDTRFEHVLEPVVGKAIPVYKGEILRLTQIEGGQCVDFNAYNLHDYKEFLDCGMNRLRGIDTGKGTVVWSGSPRGRPMYTILEISDTCDQYYAGHRCTGLMYEMEFGLPEHPNCQDTFAEAIREYGLTPDDVHDSYNLWMTTSLDSQGRRIYPDNRGQPGDFCDFLAFFDTLAVPVICAGDLSGVNSFYPRAVRVNVFESSPDTMAIVDGVNQVLGSYVNQKTPSDFAISEVRQKRELERDPSYTATYKPMGPEMVIEMDLAPQEEAVCMGLMARGIYGKSFDYCLVASLCRWFEMNRSSLRRASINFVRPAEIAEAVTPSSAGS